MNASLWRAELTFAFDYCKWGAESVFIISNLIFQYFSHADLVVLLNRVHNTNEEVSLNNNKRIYGITLLLFPSDVPIITLKSDFAHTPLVIFSLIDMLV